MSYDIRLEPSGHRFTIQPGERIMQAAHAAGFMIPTGCRMGTCRSCRGRVMSGVVDLGGAHPAYLPEAHRRQGYALLCQATAKSDLVIEIEEVPAAVEPQIAPALVKSIERISDDVLFLKLRLPLHLNLLFEAGQYVDFLLNGGIRRSYSIANPPKAEGVINLEFHIRRMPGGLFTDYMFDHMKEREKLMFEAPLGGFFLRDSAKPVLFLATGTGYAPIRSILLKHLPRNRERRMVLYWGGRTPQDLYLMDEARELAQLHPNFTFIPVVSRPVDSDAWSGATGRVHLAAMGDLPDLSGWQTYACGLPAMVEESRSRLIAERGLPNAEFFADPFTSMADSPEAATQRECS
jgi:CDP-4-dehydro-6-deoxyglucose reductase